MNWFLSRKKDYTAKINADRELLVKAGDTLLDAGLEAGLAWSHDCRSGLCGRCQCRLTKGRVKRLSDFSFVLDSDQLADGMILACQSQLQSNIELEVEFDENAEPIELLKTTADLIRVESLTYDIVRIVLRTADPLPESARAGQYAEIKHHSIEKARSYSFASAPENESNNELSFFIRLVPGGEFTEWLFAADRTGEKFALEAPFGDFWLREGAGPMVCLAGGSGISAVKAVLEHAANLQVERDAYFLFGAREQKDLYCRDEMSGLAERWHPDYNYEFVEVLSAEPEDSDWQGPRGYVTDHLQAGYLDTKRFNLADCQAYLCGPPPMVDAAIDRLLDEGMNEDQIFYDRFLDASNLQSKGGR